MLLQALCRTCGLLPQPMALQVSTWAGSFTLPLTLLSSLSELEGDANHLSAGIKWALPSKVHQKWCDLAASWHQWRGDPVSPSDDAQTPIQVPQQVP